MYEYCLPLGRKRGIVTGKVTEGFMGCSVYLGDGYMGMFTWLKCIKLYIHDLYTLHLSTSIRKW